MQPPLAMRPPRSWTIDTADDAAATGNAAAKAPDTADNAAATGNAAAKVMDTADMAASTDVVATTEDAVTSAVAIAASPPLPMQMPWTMPTL